MMDNYTDIGPECFTNGNVISYKGENYYRACDAFVTDRPEGGQSFCVKRVDHPGTIHEAYDGTIRDDKILVVPKLPHSNMCLMINHPHGSECADDCPTCGGRRMNIPKDLIP